MKNNKMSTWLSITVITFLLFIIGLYAIGFRATADNSPIITLSNLGELVSAGGQEAYVTGTFALFVIGLVFISIAVLLVLTKLILDELNIKTNLLQRYWDIVFLLLVVLAVIFIIAGAATYIGQSADDLDSGRAAGLFILAILSIPLNTIPLFMSNADEAGPSKVEVVQETIK